jgi:hypothetical protein
MSSTVDRLKNVSGIVKHLLTVDHRYRDSDNMLMSRIWNNEVERIGHNPKTMTAYDFFALYAAGRLSQSNIIERARRKIQEECPELRGKNWEKRHKDSEETRNIIPNM